MLQKSFTLRQLWVSICLYIRQLTGEICHFLFKATLIVERLVVLIMFWCWLQVCELDIIFNFEKAHFVLDEFIIGGEVQESSQKSVITAIAQQDILQEVCRVVHSCCHFSLLYGYFWAVNQNVCFHLLHLFM